MFNIFNSIILPLVWSIRAKDTKWLADLIPPGARYILFEWLGVIVTAESVSKVSSSQHEITSAHPTLLN